MFLYGYNLCQEEIYEISLLSITSVTFDDRYCV